MSDEEKRNRVAYEILSTEEAYVLSLQNLFKVSKILIFRNRLLIYAFDCKFELVSSTSSLSNKII